MLEKDFQKQITDLARQHGWHVIRFRKTQGNEKGWPDLTLIPTREDLLSQGVQYWKVKVNKHRIRTEQRDPAAGALARFVFPSDW